MRSTHIGDIAIRKVVMEANVERQQNGFRRPATSTARIGFHQFADFFQCCLARSLTDEQPSRFVTQKRGRNHQNQSDSNRGYGVQIWLMESLGQQQSQKSESRPASAAPFSNRMANVPGSLLP
jgi:hypothetical protein